ncbi:protein kinase activating protein dpb11 [Coemansia sp. RSA 988]|nr:protein kinase activating protein dpb11 [Coemansia sp. RSA 988]
MSTPTYSLLSRCCISCSGLEASEKEAVHRRIEQLGGSVSFQLTNLVTHVITKDSLLSNKYRVSAKVGLPVVSMDFLIECENEARRHTENISHLLASDNARDDSTDAKSTNVDDATRAIRRIVEKTWYRPFSGCHICTTGFDHDIREEIKSLVSEGVRSNSDGHVAALTRYVQENGLESILPNTRLIGGGGVYHGVLTPACTHLIAQAPEGQKYKFAKHWNVRVVTIEWLLQSLRTGYRQSEEEYTFETSNKVYRQDISKSPPGIPQAIRRLSTATSIRSSPASLGAAKACSSRSLVSNENISYHGGNTAKNTSNIEIGVGSKSGANFTGQRQNMKLLSKGNIQDPQHINSASDSLTVSDDAFCRVGKPRPAASHLSSISLSSTDSCMALAPCRIILSEASMSAEDCKSWRKRISTMGGVWIAKEALAEYCRRLETHDVSDIQRSLCTHYVVGDTEYMADEDRSTLHILADSAVMPYVISSSWLSACWRAKARVAENLYLLHGQDIAAEVNKASTSGNSLSGKRSSFVEDYTTDMHLHQSLGSPFERHPVASRRSAIASGTKISRLPPQPRYTANHHLVATAAQPTRNSRLLDDEPVQEYTIRNTELDPAVEDKSSYNDAAEPQATGYSSSPLLELSTHSGGTHLFTKCAFTSFGLSGVAQAVLKQAANENGGTYVDIELNALTRNALFSFAHLTDGHGVGDTYVVIPLGGADHLQLCEEVLATVDQHVHIVTECWFEQCLQDGRVYPDYWHIVSRSLEFPGLSKGQHVLFYPLRETAVKELEGIYLSISGYEGLERKHIGMLASALGVPFSEIFCRKTTHLICSPPFSGKKYERALKRGISVVDATWVYSLAIIRANSNTGITCAVNPVPIANTSQIQRQNQECDHGDTEQLARISAEVNTDKCSRDVTIAKVTTDAMITPLRLCSQLPTSTPGQTPIDVSLDRNLDQAMYNNKRHKMRRVATTFAHGNHSDNSGADDDDVDDTQMSPLDAPGSSMTRDDGNIPGNIGPGSGYIGVLDGVVIALSSRLYYRRKELTELARGLGCRVLGSFDVSQATHLVHQSTRERELLRDFRLAAKSGIMIVSPWWLRACREAGAHVPESDFPHTFHPERRLNLISSTPTKIPPKPAAAGSALVRNGDPVSAEHRLSHCNSRHAVDLTHVYANTCKLSSDDVVNTSSKEQAQKAALCEGSDALTSVDGTAAISSLIGERAARTHRRYRQKLEDANVVVGRDNMSTAKSEFIRTSSGTTLTAPRDRRQQHQRLAQSSPPSGSLKVATDNKIGCCSNGTPSKNVEHLRDWWTLNLDTAATDGHEPIDSRPMYSQEPQPHFYSGLDSIPDTAAVEEFLNTPFCNGSTSAAFLVGTGMPCATTSSSSRMVTAISSTGALSSRDEATVLPQTPQQANSPPVAHRTTIVYGEDIDALSERDQLLQRLVGN